MTTQTTIPTHSAEPQPAAVSNLLVSDAKEQQGQPLLRIPVQRKLSIGSVDDPLEREADEMAARIMRSPSSSFIQRKCAHCEEEEKIHRKPFDAFLQKKGNDNSVVSDAVSHQIHSTKGSGTALPENTRSFMESRFDSSFSDVRIHTGDYAVQLSTQLNAQAFTTGNDIYFNAGKFSDYTDDGKHLLAHELTHTLQQKGRGPSIMRFGSDEHRRIGDSVVTQNVLITGYGTFSFGEMIAIAGDYFESIDEISRLAQNWGQFGRDQIDYVLWKVNPTRPRPSVSQNVIDTVMDRYNRLAARNESHFSTGSSPGNSNRERYIEIHRQAVMDAFAEGSNPLVVRGWTWQAREGFAQHFLTDAFSAGHVRTQRGAIQRHWSSLYPNFTNNLVTMISCYMASHINERDRIGWVRTVDQLTSDIEPRIRAQAGSILSTYSIGDLISKVLHDADNAGLDVISPRSVSGTGPFRWRAVGDGYLFPSSGAGNTAQQQTQQMIREAIRLSFDEGQQAYSAGIASDFSARTRLSNSANFRALELLPAEDTSSTTNPVYLWNVPTLAALPVNIQRLITAAFLPGTEIRSGLDGISVPCITTVWNFDLHTGDAFECFKRKLLGNVWGTILEIGSGTLCPPGQNDPCSTLRNPCP